MRLLDLKVLDETENARFMPAGEFNQLTANIKKDGVMTTVPLIHEGVVLSGNHRVQAAIAAGLLEADVIEVVGEVTPERLLALQLSHNAISGQDNPNTLKRLYSSLSFEWRKYSGLTDGELGQLKEIDIQALGIGAPQYQELVLLFLPTERERFALALEKIKKRLDTFAKKDIIVHTTRLEDFDAVFDAMVKVKNHASVYNSAIALRVLADLAVERIEQIAEEHGVADG